jgi:phosphopantetheine--protein transferase-like protein
MDAPTRLRQLVAPLAGVGEADLTRGSQLAGRLKTSIGRATLDALLRREFGTRGTAAYQVNTFGELEDAVVGPTAGGATAEPVRAAVSDAPLADGVGVGIDIERTDQLPHAADYWDAPFYRAHFTADEIAYCARQEAPREHFAVRWCAKEALKKCDPRFTSCAFEQLEVVAETTGRIRLATTRTGSRELLPHTVSVSHTSDLAVAVVHRPQTSEPVPLPPAHAPIAASRAVSPTFPTVLAIVACLLALLGLYRTF